MPTQAKAEKIEELTEKLGRAAVTILVQTQGLTVKDMTDLRNRMRAAKIEFQVAKNTLLRIATAKAVSDYVRTSKIAVLKSGILGGRTLTANQVEDLARIPGGKNYARAQVVGTIQGPMSTTYSLLTAPMRDLCYVLQAHADQLNGGATPE